MSCVVLVRRLWVRVPAEVRQGSRTLLPKAETVGLSPSEGVRFQNPVEAASRPQRPRLSLAPSAVQSGMSQRGRSSLPPPRGIQRDDGGSGGRTHSCVHRRTHTCCAHRCTHACTPFLSRRHNLLPFQWTLCCLRQRTASTVIACGLLGAHLCQVPLPVLGLRTDGMARAPV